jgi:hypothetical protein
MNLELKKKKTKELRNITTIIKKVGDIEFHVHHLQGTRSHGH